MSREVQFSFDTEGDKVDFTVYAKAKGMSLPALVKYATYQYRARYPLTAAEAAGERRKPGRPRKLILSVQSELSGASGGPNGIAHPKPEQDSSLAACAQGNSNSKNKTKTLSTEAASPLYHRIEKGFLNQNGGKFTDYGKEGKAIHGLIDKARARDGENAEALLATVCAAFWKLKNGGDKFWRGQPFLPSVLNSSGIWDRVLESMRRDEVPEDVRKIIQEATGDGIAVCSVG